MLKRLACALLPLLLLLPVFSFAMADDSSQAAEPSGLVSWSPTPAKDFLRYTMNFSAVDVDTLEALDGSTSARQYRCWFGGSLDSLITIFTDEPTTDNSWVTVSGNQAQHFDKQWTLPLSVLNGEAGIGDYKVDYLDGTGLDYSYIEELAKTFPVLTPLVRLLKSCAPEFLEKTTLHIDLNSIRIRITRTDPDYRIPTGELKYSLTRDFNGAPEWLKTILNTISRGLSFVESGWAKTIQLCYDKILMEVLKSGLPGDLESIPGQYAADRDCVIEGELRQKDFSWLTPGKAKYWIEAHLQRKTFEARQIVLYVPAGKDAVQSAALVDTSSGKKYTLTYDANFYDNYADDGEVRGAFVTDSTDALPVGDHYALEIDGVSYPIAVNGFSVPRDEKGYTDQVAYGKLSALEKKAIANSQYRELYGSVPSTVKLAIPTMENSDQPYDNEWHLAESLDTTGRVTVHNPSQVQSYHVFEYTDGTMCLFMESIWQTNGYDAALPSEVWLKLYKTVNGEKVYYSGEQGMADGDKRVNNATLFALPTTAAGTEEDPWVRRIDYSRLQALRDFLKDAKGLGIEQCDANGVEQTWACFDTSHAVSVQSDGVHVQAINVLDTDVRFFKVDENGGIITDSVGIAAFTCEDGQGHALEVVYDEETEGYVIQGVVPDVTYTLRETEAPSEDYQTGSWLLKRTGEDVVFTAFGGGRAEQDEDGVWCLTDEYVEGTEITFRKVWEDDETPANVTGVRLAVEWMDDEELLGETALTLYADESWTDTLRLPVPQDGDTLTLSVMEEAYLLRDGTEADTVSGWESVGEAVFTVGGTQSLGVCVAELDGDEPTEVTVTNRKKAFKIYKSEGARILTDSEVVFSWEEGSTRINAEFDELSRCFRVRWNGTAGALTLIENRAGTPSAPGAYVGEWVLNYNENGELTAVTPSKFVPQQGMTEASARIDEAETDTVWVQNPANRFEATVEKDWGATDPAALGIDSVRVLILPVLRWTNENGTITYEPVDAADAGQSRSYTLSAANDWKLQCELTDGSDTGEEGLIYAVRETALLKADGTEVDTSIQKRFAATYEDANGGDSWTYGETTYSGDSNGILQNADGLRTCVIRNTDGQFKVRITWVDESNAGDTRPETVRLVLQRKSGDDWVSLQTVDIPDDGGAWEGDDRYIETFSVDYGTDAEYRVRLQVQTAAGEYVPQSENGLVLSMRDVLWRDGVQGDDSDSYLLRYDDSCNESQRIQTIELTLRDRVPGLVIWEDEGHKALRPDGVTLRLMRSADDGATWTQASDTRPVTVTDFDEADQGSCFFYTNGTEEPLYRVSIDNGTIDGDTVLFDNGTAYTIEYDDDEDAPSVTLAYQAQGSGSVTVQLPLRKVITTADGQQAPETAFVFVLSANSAACPMPQEDTLTITGEGSGAFAIEYTAPGVYAYTLKERDSAAAGYTCDTAARTVRVTVTRGEDELRAVWTVNNLYPEAILFHNRYEGEPAELSIPVRKEIDGETPRETADFRFVLKAASADAPLPAATILTITGEGSAAFGPISYTAPGVYRYTLYEENDGLEGYRYDEAARTIEVTVAWSEDRLKVTRWTVDGKERGEAVFRNQYHRTEVPKTGDINHPAAYLLLLIGSAAALLLMGRRKPGR